MTREVRRDVRYRLGDQGSDTVQALQEREDYGVAKYGRSLETFNGRSALTDAYQEAIDLVQYLKQELMERDELERKLIEMEGRAVKAEAELLMYRELNRGLGKQNFRFEQLLQKHGIDWMEKVDD